MMHTPHLGIKLLDHLRILGCKVVTLARVVLKVVKLQRTVLPNRHALPVSAAYCALLARKLPV